MILQDADINPMLQLSQLDKLPRFKLIGVTYNLYSSSQITLINYFLL